MRWALARTAPRTESRKEMMGLKSRTILGFNRDHGFAKGFSKRLATHDRDTGLCRKDTMTSKATRQSPQNSAFGTRRCLARVTCVRILSSLQLPSELFQTLCVTFLVGFFSYCRYRDSTIFPPVGNTLLVYNKTTIACVQTRPHRGPHRLPQSQVLLALPAQQLIPLAPLRACPSVPSSMYGTPIICKNIYGNLLCAKTCMRHLLCTSPRAPGKARDPKEQKGDSGWGR